jgi:hypothetical protein
MMRLLLLAPLFLAACSPAAPPKPTEGAAQKAIMEKANAAYAKCISDGAATIAIGDEPAGSIGDRVVIACKPLRNALMADVIAFHQIGHPKFSISQSRAVAEASIATIEDELRQQTVLTIFRRQSATPAPQKAAK